MANRYWVNGNGTWGTGFTGVWASTSGGAGGASVPTSADDVFFDANSDTGGNFTVTIDTGMVCRDLTFSGLDRTINFGGTSGQRKITIYGNLQLPSSNFSATYLANWVFDSTRNDIIYTLTGNNQSLSGILYFQPSGTSNVTWKLQDNFQTTSNLLVVGGNVNLNNKDLSCGNVKSISGVLDLTSGNLILTGSIFDPEIRANSIIGNSYNIIINTQGNFTFIGAGKTYNNLIITGNTSNTFTTLYDYFSLNKISANKNVPHTVTFPSGVTTKTNQFSINGSPGNLVTITTGYTGKTTLSNPTAKALDYYGCAVAISDTYAIVGVPDATDANSLPAQKAYIYKLSDLTSNNTMNLAFTLNDPASGTASRFGQSVAVSNSYAVVGAPATIVGGSSKGRAYVYHLSNGALYKTLDHPSPATGDQFGQSVTINNSYVLIGSPETTGKSGNAFVFELSTGNLKYTFNNPNATALDDFGQSVAMSNSYAIIGAPLIDVSANANTGKAYIYTLSNGGLTYTLDNPTPFGTGAEDQFGFSVAINDSYAVVGAPREDNATVTNAGRAYIYRLSDGQLLSNLSNPITDSQVTNFGRSVGINGTQTIVGSLSTAISTYDFPTAYIFELSTGNVQYQLYDPYIIGTSSRFGYAVSMSNTASFIGAPFAGSSSSGNAYINWLNPANLLSTDTTPNTKISANFLNISNTTVSPNNTWYAYSSVNGGNNTGWTFVTDGKFLLLFF